MRSSDALGIQNDGKLIKYSYCWRPAIQTIYTLSTRSQNA
jgi:hypothetical protein